MVFIYIYFKIFINEYIYLYEYAMTIYYYLMVIKVIVNAF